MGWWSDIKQAASSAWDNIKENKAMAFVAAATIGIGICVTVFAAPVLALGAVGTAVAGIVGSAFIGAGVSSMLTVMSNNKCTWGDFFKSYGSGFVIGGVSGLFSCGASALIGAKGGALWGFSRYLVRFLLGVASSVTTNGINNLFHGEDFFKNWKNAAKTGAIIGLIGCVAEGINHFNEAAAKESANGLLTAVKEKFSSVAALKEKFTNAMNMMNPVVKFLGTSVLETAKFLGEGIAMQLLLGDGTINWQALMVGGCVAVGIGLARAGVQYRQKKKNDKLIEKTFDAAEETDKRNVETSRKQAEAKKTELTEKKQNATEEQQTKIDEKIKKIDESFNVQEETLSGKRKVPEDMKTRTIPTTTCGLQDEKGNVTTGANHGQRVVDAGGDPTKPGDAKKGFVENPHREDLPVRVKVKKGDEYIKDGVTHTATENKTIKQTETEWKQNNPDKITTKNKQQLENPKSFENRSAACAEQPAIAKADIANNGPIDLKKSKLFTVATDYQVEMHGGAVVSSETYVKPPCEQACTHIPATNLSRPDGAALGSFIEKSAAASGISIKPEQSYMDLRPINSQNQPQATKVDESSKSGNSIQSYAPSLKTHSHTSSFDENEQDFSASTTTRKGYAGVHEKSKKSKKSTPISHTSSIHKVWFEPQNKDIKKSKSSDSEDIMDSFSSDDEYSLGGEEFLEEEESIDKSKKKAITNRIQGVIQKAKNVSSSKKTVDSLEEELHYHEELRKKHQKEIDEAEKLKNDEFLKRGKVKEEKVYVFNQSEGQQLGTTDGGLTNRTPQESAQTGRERSSNLWKERRKEEKSKKKDTEKKLKSKDMIEGKKKVAEVVQIVAWSEKHNKYMMVDNKLWPTMPNGPTKLIAFLGVRRSGRTTLIHSLLFKAGYCLTKEQSILTKVPLGVNMYVLRDAGLIFLDICDSMDFIGQQQTEAPIGNVLLEVFAYLNCDHLVYSLPFGIKTNQREVEQAVSYISTRVNTLMNAGGLVEIAGAHRITLVPREDEPEEATIILWKQLQKHFDDQAAKVEVAFERIDLIESERYQGLEQEELMLSCYHKVRVCPLRFFHASRSTKNDTDYNNEFEKLWKSVNNDTGYHVASVDILEEDHEISIDGCLITTWNRLTKCNDLTEAVTSNANEIDMKKYRAEHSQQQHYIEKYFSNLNAFVQKAQNENGLIKRFKEYEEERRIASKEYEKAAEEDRDPNLFLRLLLKSGMILIEECLDMSNGDLRSEGIDLGLSIFTIMLDKSHGMMKICLLRIALFDLKMMSFLKREILYLHFHQVWVILYHMAATGFRFHLLEFPLWTAICSILFKNQELFGEKLEIFDWTAHVLIKMMDLDMVPMVPPKTQETRVNDKKLHLTMEQQQTVDYDFRIYSEDKVKKIFEQTIKEPENTLKHYDELLDMAKEFYNDHEICERTGLKYEDIHQENKEQMAHVLLNHFHKHCAVHFTKLLLDSGTVKFLITIDSEKATICRLKILNTVVRVVSNDATLFPLLLESHVHSWLLKEFLGKTDSPMTLYQEAVSLASQMFFAEQSVSSKDITDKIIKAGSQKREELLNQVNDLDSTKRRERRAKQIGRYGLFRLQSFEVDAHKIAIDRLMRERGGNTNSLEVIRKIVHFLSWHLCYTIDEEDRQNFAEPFIKFQKSDLIDQVTQMIIVAVNKLTFKNPSELNDLLTIIEMGLSFINRLMWCCFAHDFTDFYDQTLTNPEKLNPQETMIWKKLTEVLQMVYYHVLDGWKRHAMKVDFLLLALNLSSTSKITFSTVNHEVGTSRVAVLGDLNQTNPRKKGDNPEILVNEEDLSKLRLDKDDWDLKNTTRADYILFGALKNVSKFPFTIVEHSIKDDIRKYVGYMKQLLTMREENEKKLNDAIQRKKRKEKSVVMPTANEGSSYADRIQETVSRQPQERSQKRACEGIFLTTSLLDGVLLPKNGWQESGFEQLSQVYDIHVSHAYMLCLTNRRLEDKEKLHKLITHLIELFNGSNNASYIFEADVNFLSLNWIEKTLEYLKYIKSDDPGERFWYMKDEVDLGALTFLIKLQENLDKDQHTWLLLDTSFKEVEEDDFGGQTLPKDFFGTTDQVLLNILEQKTVSELREMKRRSAKELIGVKLLYFLVRVKINGKVYQGVFNREMPTSRIKQSLSKHGLSCNQLYCDVNNVKKAVSDDTKLGDLGSFTLLFTTK